MSTAGGCGDSGSGGEGGSGTGPTTGIATTTTSTGSGGCIELAPKDFFRQAYSDTQGAAAYDFDPGTPLGGATMDLGEMGFYDFAKTGKIDLASGDDGNYETCTTCLLVFEDDDSGTPAKVYFQSKGTIDLGTSVEPAVTGTISDATLVEVTLDEMTGHSTVVPGGACVHIASASFSFVAPDPGWTCDNVGFYGDHKYCDCDCGVPDPDCTDPANEVFNCVEGQTCSAAGKCEGKPTGWNCDASKYNGGAGNGCDCNCGIHDPDCDLGGEQTVGCTAMAPTCNAHDVCVPNAWDCDPDFYGDNYCDCGCGVLDPYCSSANKSACEVCDDVGSCDNVVCSDPASKINATNNAVCN